MRIFRKTAMIFLTLALALGLSLPAQAQLSIGLKLYGGYGYLLGGEGNDGVKGFLDAWTAMFVDAGASASGSYKPFHLGLDAGGDLIIYFTPAIGIGIGGGYLQAASDSKIDLTYPGGSADIVTNPKVSAIPVRASLYLSLPMGSSANLVLHGGVGYYLAKFESALRIEEGTDFLEFANKADGKGIGFHAGLGFEFNFGSNLGFVLEATARYAKIGGFEGTADISSGAGPLASESGKLYYYKQLTMGLGTFPIVGVYSTAPSGDVTDVHEAKIDFSGVAARAGLIFRF